MSLPLSLACLSRSLWRVRSAVAHISSIGVAGARALRAAFVAPRGGAITTLVLDLNQLHGEGVSLVAECLMQPNTVRALHLGSCAGGDAGAASLARALQAPACRLRILRFWGNGVTDAGAASLAGALAAHAGALELAKPATPLVELSLADNCVGAAGARALLTALAPVDGAGAPTALRRLLLFRNPIGGGATAAEDLGAGIRAVLAPQRALVLSALRTASTSGHGSAAGLHLADGKDQSSFLTSLSLAECDIGPNGIAGACGKRSCVYCVTLCRTHATQLLMLLSQLIHLAISTY
jgi:hypothetical protein